MIRGVELAQYRNNIRQWRNKKVCDSCLTSKCESMRLSRRILGRPSSWLPSGTKLFSSVCQCVCGELFECIDGESIARPNFLRAVLEQLMGLELRPTSAARSSLARSWVVCRAGQARRKASSTELNSSAELAERPRSVRELYQMRK